MSTDVLRRHISRHLDQLATLQSRGLPPLTCGFSRLEGSPPGRGYRPRYYGGLSGGWDAEAVMTDALFHPSMRVVAPHVVSSHWGTGGNHATLFFPGTFTSDPWEPLLPGQFHPARPGEYPSARSVEAIAAARQVCETLAPVIRTLPARLAERLGFLWTERPTDWVAVLFHLGWHFPDHGIEANRFRVLSAGGDWPVSGSCVRWSFTSSGFSRRSRTRTPIQFRSRRFSVARPVFTASTAPGT